MQLYSVGIELKHTKKLKNNVSGVISILIISFRFIMFRVLTSFNNTSTLDVCPSQTAANKGVMLCLSVCCKSNSFHYKIRGCIYIYFKVITKCNKL